MLEKLIFKIRQKLLIKNLINFILLLLPVITFSILQLGYSLTWIIPSIIIIILHITYNIKKYSNPTVIDKTLKLNNIVSTYHEYRYSSNPFIGNLTLKAEDELKNVDPSIFPMFETISISIMLSLFIISIYLSHQKTVNYNPNTINYQKNSDINTYRSSNSPVNKILNGQNSTHKHKSLPQYTDSNIQPFKQSNITKRKSIYIPIRNNISKEEKEIVKSITNESYCGR